MLKLSIAMIAFYVIVNANFKLVDKNFVDIISKPRISIINDTIPLNKRKKSSLGNKDLERKIVDKIFSLPEVKVKSRYIDSLTNHKSSISIMVKSKPNKKENYYRVQAGYNSELRYVPYYNFYVYPSGMKVYILDDWTTRIISLKEWRKRQKHQPLY